MWQSRPWHGPIVTVVYRFESSIESKPSAIAYLRSFVVWSSQKQTKHLSPRWSRIGLGTAGSPTSPVTAPTASTCGGQIGRHEDAAALVVLDPGACLGEQLVVRLRAAGHDDEVGLDVVAADRDLRDLAALALRLDRRAAVLAEVDDARDLDAGRLEVGGGPEAAVVDREHDGALGRA